MESKKNINVFDLWENKALPLVKRVKKFFYIPFIAAALVCTFVYFGEAKKLPVFSAKITFMLEDDILNESQKMGAGGQLLMALGGQTPQSNKAILVDLGVSNKLVEETLLRTVKVEGKDVVMVNYFMDHLGYKKSWKKDGNAKLINLAFSPGYKIGDDKEKDYWLRIFSNQIKLTLKPSLQESGLIIMNYSSNDELFTKIFLENHLTTISEFYINKKVERSINLLQLAKRKRDSLQYALTGKSYGLAGMQDQGFGRVSKRAYVPETQVTRDIAIISQQYSESVAAYSAASLDMERKKPFISVVDDIRLPLESTWPKPMNKAMGIFVFVIILGFAAIGGVLLGLDVLKSQKKEFENVKTNV